MFLHNVLFLILAPVHPYLALDLAIGQLLRYHGNSKMADCFCFLIGRIAEYTVDGEVWEPYRIKIKKK